MNSINYELSAQEIQETVRTLGLPDDVKRVQARRFLEAMGRKATLILIEALKNGNWMARKEAAIALATIKEPATASALVAALKDQDHDVRWMAMKALIAFDQDGLEPLLLALTRDFDSVHLREGARHILKTLKHDSCLENQLLNVLKALEGLEPTVTVPWAAETAWEELYGPKKKLKKTK